MLWFYPNSLNTCYQKKTALKQDWISPWSRLVWWVCAALVRSVSRRTATCRERAVESFQRAPHILESSQHPKKLHTLLRDINKSLPKYLTSEITRYIERDHWWPEKQTSWTTFGRGVVRYKDSIWHPAHCIAWQSTWQRNNAAATSNLPQLCACPCLNQLNIQVLYGVSKKTLSECCWYIFWDTLYVPL